MWSATWNVALDALAGRQHAVRMLRRMIMEGLEQWGRWVLNSYALEVPSLVIAGDLSPDDGAVPLDSAD